MITVEEFVTVAEMLFKANALAYELMRLVKKKGNACERG
jgi:hypothetical protein